MVLSASSVYSFEHHDGDSYAIVKRQLMWVVLGIPCALGRRPGCPTARSGSSSWLGILVAVVLLALTQTALGRHGQRQQELARRSARSRSSRPRSPSSRSCCGRAHVYAQKERRLGRLHQIMIPVVPVMPGDRAAGRRRPRPRHRAGAVRDPAGDAVGGRRAGPAVHRAR